ncbi:peptidase A24 [Methylobacterium sp. Leaf456]|uniref:prepilin peptidase n=1 Tax=Methylobacterium sp. Leaf456 TaxID=1736382 RepID=UPI0006FA905A|nr:A24 family peptidase [Methylobacterium sp. Leaf456]KQT59708.1 peptidase A24 [Methylobacterium sp. Leaf456]
MILDPGSLTLAALPLPITLAISVIDGHRRIIPDPLNLLLLASGLAVATLREPDPAALAACLAQAAVAFGLLWALRALYARLRGRTGLGLGDVKFVGAATAWVGLAGLPFLILIASTAALVALALAALAGRQITREFRLPFGPFLAVGLHAALLMGHAP